MTTLEAIIAQAEQSAPKKKSNKSVRRDTTLIFNTTDDMRTALARLGFNPYRTYHRTRMYDAEFGDEIDSATANMLKKHGHEVNVVDTEYEDVSWEEVDQIKEYFGIGETSLEIYTYTIRLRTWSITARQHKSIVRKVLRPIRAAGFEVRHQCESETSDYSC